MKIFCLYQYKLVIALCGLLPLASFAGLCSNYETLKMHIKQANYRPALLEMSHCLKAVKLPSVDDLEQFDALIQLVLTADSNTADEDIYRNFQIVLKNHYEFRELNFQFKNKLKTRNHLFYNKRHDHEKYYFYYDTGRILSYSRGIAFTNQSLIWRNLIGFTQHLAFDDIKTIKLIYDQRYVLNNDLSLTGWKLQINNDVRYEIRLSRLPDNAIEPFVSAMVYFINFNKTAQLQKRVLLEIPTREKAILAGWVTQCRKNWNNSHNALEQLRFLNNCLSKYPQDIKLSQADHDWLNQLMNPIFANPHISLAKGHNNFKKALSTDFFNKLDFLFKDNVNQEWEIELFKDVKKSTESYYFYFETGTLFSGSKGLALTDESIIWNNLFCFSISWPSFLGLTTRLPFENISSVTLIHEIGFISNSWKLRLNEKADYEIVLPQLSTENIELFASALVYFINVAKGTHLTLKIPKASRQVLNQTFRHPKMNSMSEHVGSPLHFLFIIKWANA
ncbi:MAG: hypothetical protein DRQ99_22040 [Candidatus Parabeggiatoa sp. nov. 3]|nr:MAG: hypothetical protein DRQ99_22040 [Gammaproteobacteria bacterium]